MNPIYLLDSNICIYVLLDASSAAAGRLAQCRRGEVVASAITYAEVLSGIRPDAVDELLGARRFFDIVAVLPFDIAAARAYAGLPFRRGSYDRLIAGHALSLNLTLVTNNERDFASLPHLCVENWTRA